MDTQLQMELLEQEVKRLRRDMSDASRAHLVALEKLGSEKEEWRLKHLRLQDKIDSFLNAIASMLGEVGISAQHYPDGSLEPRHQGLSSWAAGVFAAARRARMIHEADERLLFLMGKASHNGRRIARKLVRAVLLDAVSLARRIP